MMNYVWLALVVIAVITAAFTGNIENITKAVFDGAQASVTIAFGLIGIMSLWLGIMKIAEKAGLIQLLAKAVKPVSKFLFPEVPSDHPAIGAIMLNISANWLGLGNAATPFGIKAMEELQSLNPQKATATNSMIMFLGLNTASITLVPMTIIGVRASLHSTNPVEVIGPTIFSSCIATLTAILVVKLFINIESGFNLGRIWRSLLKVGFFFLVFILIVLAGARFVKADVFKNYILLISNWIIPFLLLMIPVLAFFKKVKIFEEFVEGAKEGFQIAVRIIPYLVAILVAIGLFRVSGAMDFLVFILSPITNLIGMPAEVLPAALMRPLSANGTLGIITELMKTHGPDSFIGRFSSTIYGCTETTFYVIAVYFGAVNIKKTRFAVPAGLIADLAGVLAALLICRILFL